MLATAPLDSRYAAQFSHGFAIIAQKNNGNPAHYAGVMCFSHKEIVLSKEESFENLY